MKKVLLVVSVCFGLNGFSQDFYHAAGLQFTTGLFNLAYTEEGVGSSESKSNASVPGVFYKASLGFEVGQNSYFNLSSYPFLGFSGNFNSQSGASGGIGFELPVLGEFYIGEPDDVCFFLSGGFSVGYVASTNSSSLWAGGTTSGSVLGPQLGIGGQFFIKDQLIGLRAAYTLGINKTKDIPSNVIVTKDTRGLLDFGVYYVLGQ